MNVIVITKPRNYQINQIIKLFKGRGYETYFSLKNQLLILKVPPKSLDECFRILEFNRIPWTILEQPIPYLRI